MRISVKLNHSSCYLVFAVLLIVISHASYAGELSGIATASSGDINMSEQHSLAEDRKAEALKVFKEYPDKFSDSVKQKILEQQVALGMSPYEAQLAGGSFFYKVQADPDNWPTNADPYKVMWAQSLKPDNSNIWMTFQTDTQYPGEGEHRFQVYFKKGHAVEITKF